jgi:hypothetical protein
MGLHIRDTHANIQLPQGTDRVGKLLLAGLDRWTMDYLVGGNGWRIHGWGDGGSAFSNTLDNYGFTGNSGKGYLDTSTAWASSAVANTITRPRAWFRIAEYVGGVATGRQVIFQRSSTTSDNGENNLICAMSLTGFTGSGLADSPPSGGTFVYLTGVSATFNGVGFQIGGSNVNINASADLLVGQVLSSTEPVNGVMPIGLLCHNKTSSAVRWSFTIEAVQQAAAADAHPLVAWCYTWSSIIGGPAINSSATMFNATTSNVYTPVNGTWENFQIARFSTPDNVVHPVGGASATHIANDDGKLPALPAYVCPDVVNVTHFKGRLDSIRVHLPTSTSHLPPATYHCATPHATEDPRASAGHITYVAYDGFAYDWTGAADRTDLVTLDPNVVEAVPDTTAPEIANISPAPGSAIEDDEVIEFDVTDAGDIAYLAIYARYLDKRDYDVVYAHSEFAPKYAGSTVEEIEGGYHFAITRAVALVGGWAAQGRVRFVPAVVDASGNVEAA